MTQILQSAKTVKTNKQTNKPRKPPSAKNKNK